MFILLATIFNCMFNFSINSINREPIIDDGLFFFIYSL